MFSSTSFTRFSFKGLVEIEAEREDEANLLLFIRSNLFFLCSNVFSTAFECGNFDGV